MDDDDSSLHETPAEFMNAVATLTGRCDGQSVIRGAQGYAVGCSCGWRATAATGVEGLRAAVAHTGDEA
ncbi:hypothetical protein GCM10009836_54460 [Pseudonocardia ailaonensis]|uniref:Uncharacterized protein n=1 Tax=Pseudonocardia ailaonensis TaxID=367279 RepID=A0ABN2NHP7_9PSEU